MKPKSLALLILAVIWLVVSLACNFPKATQAPGEDISAEALRQTLAALSTGASPGETLSPTETTPPPVVAPSLVPTEPTASPATTIPWPTYPVEPGEYYTYLARSGDTLAGLGGRFDVNPGEIRSDQPIAVPGYLTAGQVLIIPNKFNVTSPPEALLPDSEIVYSPAAAGFDLAAFVQQADGFLSGYQETVDEQVLSGAAILQRVASELSVNPRLLLAFLEYRSGWVYAPPGNSQDTRQPIGFGIPGREGLYQEIMITATQLNVAYYGWREGKFPSLRFSDSTTLRINPVLNPGSVAVQHLLAMFQHQDAWQEDLRGTGGFLGLYARMFGDPWGRLVDPLLPADLAQPELELPFQPGEYWSLTAGPHFAWNSGTPRGALDFSPISGGAACAVSSFWARAAAAGQVVRSADSAVALDLDGDGSEQTGWVLVYMHLAESERVAAGTQADLDDPLGHPSCEGGRATGKHVHLARKYNGEWLWADGAVPFVLSGWRAVAGERNYQGSLVKGDQVVTPDPSGGRGSTILR